MQINSINFKKNNNEIHNKHIIKFLKHRYYKPCYINFPTRLASNTTP